LEISIQRCYYCFGHERPEGELSIPRSRRQLVQLLEELLCTVTLSVLKESISSPKQNAAESPCANGISRRFSELIGQMEG
jgi:hypothetical protein